MSVPTVPVCDVARSIPKLRDRLRHYRTCPDPRCRKRLAATLELKAELAKGLKLRETK